MREALGEGGSINPIRRIGAMRQELSVFIALYALFYLSLLIPASCTYFFKKGSINP